MSQSNAGNGNNRLILLLIAGTPVTMLLAASWLWYFVVEGDLDLVGILGTANNGRLIQPPRQVSEVPFRDDVGVPYAWGDEEARWTMLVVNPGPVCEQACERRLYTTRQIHIALGKDFNRIGRVYLSDRPISDSRVVLPPEANAGVAQGDSSRFAELGPFLAREHRGMTALAVAPEDLVELFPELEQQPAQWYLVDPAGWIMMRFTDDIDHKAVLSDLKFLLKNSGGA